MEYLVESALLTHGLKSVSNETIKKEWQDPGKKITWIDHGEIRIGDIDEFLEFRIPEIKKPCQKNRSAGLGIYLAVLRYFSGDFAIFPPFLG